VVHGSGAYAFKFCQNLCIPQKAVRISSNQKPWVTKDLKNRLDEKNETAKEKDRAKLKEAQTDVNKLVKKCKRNLPRQG